MIIGDIKKTIALNTKRLMNLNAARKRYLRSQRGEELAWADMPKPSVKQGIDLLEYAPTVAENLPKWLSKLSVAQFAAVVTASAVQCFDTLTPQSLSGILSQCRERLRGRFVSVEPINAA